MANITVTNLAKFREQMLENAGGPAFVFDLTWADKTTGEVRNEKFLMPHPMLAGEGASEAINHIDEKGGPERFGRALLDTEDDPHVYDRFLEAGGNPEDLGMVWRAMNQAVGQNGFSLPKADTPSS